MVPVTRIWCNYAKNRKRPAVSSAPGSFERTPSAWGFDGMSRITHQPSPNGTTLLGVDKTVLEAFKGVPAMSFMYRGNEIYVYDDEGFSTFELKDGVVVKSNNLPDRRKAFRARPAAQVKAKLRLQLGEIAGYLSDISLTGAAVMVPRGHQIDKEIGSVVFLKCLLPLPDEPSPHDFALKGTIHRVTSTDNREKVIILFSQLYNSPEYQRLSRYVMFRQVEIFLRTSDP